MLKIEIHEMNDFQLTCYQVDLDRLRNKQDRYKGWLADNKQIIFELPTYSGGIVNIRTAGRITIGKHNDWFIWIDHERNCILSDAMYRVIFPNTETISNGTVSE
jgi:hypothetical protein